MMLFDWIEERVRRVEIFEGDMLVKIVWENFC